MIRCMAPLLVAANIITQSSSAASATEPKKAGPSAEPTQREIEAWLESRSLPADISAEATPEAPPPPPREPGIVLEGAVGALGHAGEMRYVSPTSPWFHLKVGWEPARWAMLFVLSDVAFGSTSLANPPPEPRGFALWGFGGGFRATWEPTDWLGVFAQLEFGAAEVAEPVLGTYGFEDADSLGPYFGAMAGAEWYQISPHYALVAQGGVRHYGQMLDRQLSDATPLAWIASLGLSYTLF
jgi:hypothetical protein